MATLPVILPLDGKGTQYACCLQEDRFPRDRCAPLDRVCDRLVVGGVFAGLGCDAQPHTDFGNARMQPFSSRLPGRNPVLLLLRHLGVHASLPSLLCLFLCRADRGADADSNTYPV